MGEQIIRGVAVCKNCVARTAVLKAVDGERHFLCDYCDTQVAAPEIARSIDGLKAYGEASDLSCPNCPDGGELFHGLLDDQKVDFCPLVLGSVLETRACEFGSRLMLGVWLETGDFATLVRDCRMAYSGPGDQPSPVSQDALRRRPRMFDVPWA